jgi:hypothetical protein
MAVALCALCNTGGRRRRPQRKMEKAAPRVEDGSESSVGSAWGRGHNSHGPRRTAESPGLEICLEAMAVGDVEEMQEDSSCCFSFFPFSLLYVTEPVRSAYQPPDSNTFLSERTSHQQPAATSQQYSSLRTNQHQPSATSQPHRLLCPSGPSPRRPSSKGWLIKSIIYGTHLKL